MIIFDRFLCCISLKTFGKFFGWAGTVICVFLAYAIFLVLSGRKTAGDKNDGNSLYAYPQFSQVSVMLIVLLIVAAIFHVLLICGVKFVSILDILIHIFIHFISYSSNPSSSYPISFNQLFKLHPLFAFCPPKLISRK